MIDYEKLIEWLSIQLQDIKMVYDAMGNDRAYGAINAYEAMLAQITLLMVIEHD